MTARQGYSTELTAQLMGMASFQTGYRLKDNPFPPGDEWHTNWKQGHKLARLAAKQRRVVGEQERLERHGRE